MKTLEQIKKELAKEIGEDSGIDFMVEAECDVGDYDAARSLWMEVINRFIKQYDSN